MMAEVVMQRSAENRQFVRQLLRRKQPGFAVVLELALMLAERNLRSPRLTEPTSAPLTGGDLYAHRATIAALLSPWFDRRTLADLTAAFAGTSVPWARLHDRTGRPGSR
jgi:crotonobetainyl-CoA:carnitine CoA-transferase CaiB-like acyl-CoA transferase